MGNAHSADSANGRLQIRQSVQAPAVQGLPEGESKWALAGIAVGVVGCKNWCSPVGAGGNTSIGHMKGEDLGDRNSRPEMSGHKLAVAMNRRLAIAVVLDDAGIADCYCIPGGLVDWVLCRRCNPCLLLCLLFSE